jgi:hypothetical protein
MKVAWRKKTDGARTRPRHPLKPQTNDYQYHQLHLKQMRKKEQPGKVLRYFARFEKCAPETALAWLLFSMSGLSWTKNSLRNRRNRAWRC